MKPVSDPSYPICVNRILVSLDSSKHSFAALHAAIDLAHHYDADLRGVFIEDTALLGLADMPFRQEVGEYSANVREISPDGITRGIFVQSRWVVRTFRKLINRTNLSGEIAVLRGAVNKTITQESEKCDLLILGKSGTNPLPSRRLGSTTKAMIRHQQIPLLLVEEDNRLGYPMIVLFVESNTGQTALETASDLLDPGQTLIILLCEDNLEEFEKSRKRLSRWASDKQINISYQPYTKRAFKRFLQQIHGVKTGLLILPQIQKIPERHLVDLILETVSLPILIIC